MSASFSDSRVEYMTRFFPANFVYALFFVGVADEDLGPVEFRVITPTHRIPHRTGNLMEVTSGPNYRSELQGIEIGMHFASRTQAPLILRSVVRGEQNAMILPPSCAMMNPTHKSGLCKKCWPIAEATIKATLAILSRALPNAFVLPFYDGDDSIHFHIVGDTKGLHVMPANLFRNWMPDIIWMLEGNSNPYEVCDPVARWDAPPKNSCLETVNFLSAESRASKIADLSPTLLQIPGDVSVRVFFSGLTRQRLNDLAREDRSWAADSGLGDVDKFPVYNLWISYHVHPLDVPRLMLHHMRVKYCIGNRNSGAFGLDATWLFSIIPGLQRDMEPAIGFTLIFEELLAFDRLLKRYPNVFASFCSQIVGDKRVYPGLMMFLGIAGYKRLRSLLQLEQGKTVPLSSSRLSSSASSSSSSSSTEATRQLFRSRLRYESGKADGLRSTGIGDDSAQNPWREFVNDVISYPLFGLPSLHSALRVPLRRLPVHLLGDPQFQTHFETYHIATVGVLQKNVMGNINQQLLHICDEILVESVQSRAIRSILQETATEDHARRLSQWHRLVKEMKSATVNQHAASAWNSIRTLESFVPKIVEFFVAPRFDLDFRVFPAPEKQHVNSSIEWETKRDETRSRSSSTTDGSSGTTSRRRNWQNFCQCPYSPNEKTLRLKWFLDPSALSTIDVTVIPSASDFIGESSAARSLLRQNCVALHQYTMQRMKK